MYDLYSQLALELVKKILLFFVSIASTLSTKLHKNRRLVNERI